MVHGMGRATWLGPVGQAVAVVAVADVGFVEGWMGMEEEEEDSAGPSVELI